MMHLVELTKPGPFAVRTIALGSYIGIRDRGQLVAMAGERLRFDGFTEISGVCSHPDHRGRGYPSLLVSTSDAANLAIAATHRFCISSTITRGLPRSTGSLASRHDVLLQ